MPEEKDKEKRIEREDAKLRASLKTMTDNAMRVVDGLIKRAAYMKATLEDFEQDLDENGFTEMFSQSEKTEPYERERPVAKLYNTMNKNYQTIVKQLGDLLPNKTPTGGDKDDFDEF